MVVFFFGGTNILVNTLLVIATLFGMIWVRSTFPRVRIDHLFK
jgi:NADH:ubiquinone oxidoreductase subunit H